MKDSLPVAEVCGVRIWALTLDQVVEEITERIARGEGGRGVTVNLEMVARARRDRGYAAILESADFAVADGMPVVWASRKKAPLGCPERVTGVELTRDLLRRVPSDQVAIVGGADPHVALRALGIERRGILVIDGRFTAGEESYDRLATQLGARRLVFVALGVPKQDLFCIGLRERMPAATFLPVGGTFELIAGQKPRAPAWMQRSGLEWLFRLGAEPKRLWRRYLIEYWGGALAIGLDLRRSRN